MKVSLLISTYNWPEALNVVLKSVESQTVLPNEILIADDGSKAETQDLIEGWKKKSKLNIKYFWQEDDGFRKTIIMNKAIANAENQYIIQIDGDILLNKYFIEDHIGAAKKGFFVLGSRGLINEENTNLILANQSFDEKLAKKNIKNKINATRFPLGSFFLSKNQMKSRNVKGCNFAFWKDDFIAVNGYNNEMNGWGHEDIELAARLNNFGIKQKKVKLIAVCYHLHHSFNDRSNENKNFAIYENVVANKVVVCENGYHQCK